MKRLLTIIAMTVILPAASNYATAGDGKGASIERLLDLGMTEEASRAIDTMPPSEQPLWLARRSFYGAEYEAALRHIRELSGGRDKKAEALERYYEALAEVRCPSKSFESDHFIFRAGGTDVILAPYALESLEKTCATIERELGFHPAGRVIVEVYPDRSSFSLGTTLEEGVIERSGTVGLCKFNRLMILSPSALPLGYRWLDTLSHEYIHYAVNRLSRGRCPLWLHEGIARYYDTLWRKTDAEFLSPASENALASARRSSKYVPFSRMYPSLVYLKDQEEITLAFAEVAVAVHLLRTGHDSGLPSRLLAALAEREMPAAFTETVGMDPGRFEKRLHEYIKAMPLEESPGAAGDQVLFSKEAEEALVGADLKGQVRLGDEMRGIGRYDAAVVHYEKALVSEPANPVILVKLARALVAEGDRERAGSVLATAIEKNPHYVTAYQALGEMQFEAGDYAGAAESFAGAIALNPFHPGSHHRLSRACLAMGKADLARRELEAVVRLAPGDLESRMLLLRMEQERR